MNGHWWAVPDLILDNKAPSFVLGVFVVLPGAFALVLSWLS